MKMKNLFSVILLFLSFLLTRSAFATDTCEIRDAEPGTDKQKLICGQKSGWLQFDNQFALRRYLALNSKGKHFLVMGGPREVIFNGKTVFRAQSSVLYMTSILALDSDLNVIAVNSFSDQSMTILGGIGSMPATIVEFGEFLGILNYFEMLPFEYPYSVSIFSATDLGRVTDLKFKSSWSIREEHIATQGAELEILVSIYISYEENQYFGLHLPKGFHYWIRFGEDFRPRVHRSLPISRKKQLQFKK